MNHKQCLDLLAYV